MLEKKIKWGKKHTGKHLQGKIRGGRKKMKQLFTHLETEVCLLMDTGILLSIGGMYWTN